MHDGLDSLLRRRQREQAADGDGASHCPRPPLEEEAAVRVLRGLGLGEGEG